eukprot:334001-Chlamydomonas_euryale.AAC.4
MTTDAAAAAQTPRAAPAPRSDAAAAPCRVLRFPRRRRGPSRSAHARRRRLTLADRRPRLQVLEACSASALAPRAAHTAAPWRQRFRLWLWPCHAATTGPHNAAAAGVALIAWLLLRLRAWAARRRGPAARHRLCLTPRSTLQPGQLREPRRVRCALRVNLMLHRHDLPTEWWLGCGVAGWDGVGRGRAACSPCATMCVRYVCSTFAVRVRYVCRTCVKAAPKLGDKPLEAVWGVDFGPKVCWGWRLCKAHWLHANMQREEKEREGGVGLWVSQSRGQEANAGLPGGSKRLLSARPTDRAHPCAARFASRVGPFHFSGTCREPVRNLKVVFLTGFGQALGGWPTGWPAGWVAGWVGSPAWEGAVHPGQPRLWAQPPPSKCTCLAPASALLSPQRVRLLSLTTDAAHALPCARLS